MALYSIPLPSSVKPLTQITTSLGGGTYTFVYDWNSATDRWTVSVFDIDNNTIIAGVRLVPDFQLFRVEVSDALPTGVFFIRTPEKEITLESIDDCTFYFWGPE